jgi:hypothetical protein
MIPDYIKEIVRNEEEKKRIRLAEEEELKNRLSTAPLATQISLLRCIPIKTRILFSKTLITSFLAFTTIH